MTTLYFGAALILSTLFYFAGRYRASAIAGGGVGHLHSLPGYHAALLALLVIAPALAVYAVGMPLVSYVAEQSAVSALSADGRGDALKAAVSLRDVKAVVAGQNGAKVAASSLPAVDAYRAAVLRGEMAIWLVGFGLALIAATWTLMSISPAFRARHYVERFVYAALIASAGVAVLTTFGIVLSVVGETYRFFFDPSLAGRPSVTDFLFGLEWNPQSALRADQGEIKTAFGFIPLLVGTLLITTIAISVAAPLGLYSAIYLSEYASPRVRALAKPILEVLAGIPTVVLGFFAALTVAPAIRYWGSSLGLDVASESALAAGLVMGMMIIPFVSSLSDDVINAVPQSLRDGAYALGATKSETIKQVVLPAALPGIVSAMMLAISRAIGETMIVVMAAGLAANLTVNPLAAVTTITVQMKTILVGDQEFNSAKTLAAFALGLMLFLVTLLLNLIALRIVKKYKEQYD